MKNSTADHDYVLVGLTGSIGSGKSTVADMFQEAGIPVLRADDIARELMASDPEMIAAIKREFGEAAYRDGQLDRPYLASQIFNDREKLERMNAIVHPRTIAEQGVRARNLVEEGARIVACEAALIFESGGEGRFDYIVVVDADPQIRFARAASRDSSLLEEIERRDAMQMPASRKTEQADFVIGNNGTLDELRRNAGFIIRLLKSLPPRERIETEEEPENE
jgi:dephospho-CoA kinase